MSKWFRSASPTSCLHPNSRRAVLLCGLALTLCGLPLGAAGQSLTLANNVGSTPSAGQTVTFTVNLKAGNTPLAGDLYLTPLSSTLAANQFATQGTSGGGQESVYAYMHQTLTGNTLQVQDEVLDNDTLIVTPTLTAPASGTFGFSVYTDSTIGGQVFAVAEILSVGGAPTFTVNTLSDDAVYVDGSASGPFNCLTGSTTPCTLRDAVTAANLYGPGGATIVFAPSLAGTQGAPAVITLSNGQLASTNSVTIQGPGADVLQISGNNNSRIFEINLNTTVNLSGLTFMQGNGTGGGISGYGGALFAAGTLNLTDSTISGNSTTEGGGLYASGNATLARVSVTGNTASMWGGGIETEGAMTLTDSTISGNTVPSGGTGGAGIFYFATGATFTMTGSTVTGNASPGGEGGGILTNNSGIISNSIVAGNTAGTYPDIDGVGGSSGKLYTDNGGNLAPTATSTTGLAPYTAATLLLAPLNFYGGHTLSMPPLPGSPAVCAGSLSRDGGVATDQRGHSHSPYYCSASYQLDSGAVQTSYGIAFATQPGNSFVNQSIAGPPAVLLTESGLPFTASPVTLNFGLLGSGSLSNGSATTSTASGLATLTASINAASTNDVLSATLVAAGASGGNVASLRVTSVGFEEIGPVSVANSTFSLQSNAIAAAGSTNAVVVLKDSVGNAVAVAGTAVYFTLIGPTGNAQTVKATAQTDATGTAYYLLSGLAPGAYTVAAYANSTRTQQIGSTANLQVTIVASMFGLSGFNNPEAIQQPSNLTVTAEDANGNTVTGFTGTVSFTSTDALAVLPAPYTFISSDAGVHTFMGLSLATAGAQSITVTSGAGSSAITGIANIVVTGSTWIVNSDGTVSRLNGVGTVLATAGTSGGTSTFGGIAIDATGNAWSVGNATNALVEVNATGSNASSYTGGGLSAPVSIAVDGDGQLWVANANNSVSVFSNAGTAVSPASGYGAASGGVPTPFSTPSGIAIDQTGSVWITNAGGSSVTRIFGAAAPVVAPLVTGVTNGTVGTRP